MINWFRELTFAYPIVFWGLLIIPALAAFVLLRKNTRASIILSSAAFIVKPKTPLRVIWKPLLLALRLIALALLIIIIARPQSHKAWIHNSKDGIDIMLSIDVSPSMQAIDIPPTRLDVAKQEAIRFIQSHPNDRIGIVAYSGEAYTASPITTDYGSLIAIVERLGLNDMEQGTAIGLGLAKAAERLEKSEAKSRIIVLLTDGDNNVTDILPNDAARLAQSMNIKVYTIGFCTDEEALQPMTQNADGSYAYGYQRTDINEKELQEIANITGGKYFRAKDEAKLQEAYDSINKLEKSSYEDNSKTEQRNEEFMPFLIALMIILLSEIVLRYTVFETTT